MCHGEESEVGSKWLRSEPFLVLLLKALETASVRIASLNSLSRGATQGQPKRKPQAKEIRNPRNRFQHENAGGGWSKEKMREEYYKLRNEKP